MVCFFQGCSSSKVESAEALRVMQRSKELEYRIQRDQLEESKVHKVWPLQQSLCVLIFGTSFCCSALVKVANLHFSSSLFCYTLAVCCAAGWIGYFDMLILRRDRCFGAASIHSTDPPEYHTFHEDFVAGAMQ